MANLYTPAQQSIIAQFTLTNEAYEKHVETIKKAMASGTPKPLGKLGAASRISAVELKHAITNMQKYWQNEDYLDLYELGKELYEMKVGPSNSVARLAYAHIPLGQVYEGFLLAQEAMTLDPTEPASYLTMANAKISSEQPKQALLWIQLAEMAQPPQNGTLKRIKEDILLMIETQDKQLEATLPYILNPALPQAIRECTFMSDLLDHDKIGESLARIREDPTIFEAEVENDVKIHGLVRELYRDPQNILVRDFSSDGSEFKDLETPFHRLSFEVLIKIVPYLKGTEVNELRKTCKLLEYWLDRPESWEALYTKTTDTLPTEDWGVKRMPSFFKAAFKSRWNSLRQTEAMSSLWQTGDDSTKSFFTTARKIAMDASIEHREFAAISLNNAADTFDSLGSDLCLGGEKTAAAYATSLAVPLSAVYLGAIYDTPQASEVISAVKFIIKLVALRGEKMATRLTSMCHILNLCSNLIGGPAHLESCALASILKAAGPIYALRPGQVFPNEVGIYEKKTKIYSSRLSGTWYFFMHFTMPDIEYNTEHGVCQMKFDQENNTFTARGADTLGAFEHTDGALELLSGMLSFKRQYKDGQDIIFEGCMTTFGMGGACAIPATDTEKPHWGTWFAVRSSLYEDGADAEAVYPMDDREPAERRYKHGDREYLHNLSDAALESKIAEYESDAEKRETKRPWNANPSPEAQLISKIRFYTRCMHRAGNPELRTTDQRLMIEEMNWDSSQSLQAGSEDNWYKGEYETEDHWKRRLHAWSIASTYCNMHRASLCHLLRAELMEDLPQLGLIDPSVELSEEDQKLVDKWSHRLSFSSLFYRCPAPYEFHDIFVSVLSSYDEPEEDEEAVPSANETDLSKDFIGSVRRRNKQSGSSNLWIIGAVAATIVAIAGAFTVGTLMARKKPSN